MTAESEELMKRIKRSSFVKLIAWIVFILSVNIFVVSTCGMFLIAELGFYTQRYTEVRRLMLEEVNRNYSAEAVIYRGAGLEEKFASEYFEYGIIQAEQIADLDLSDPDIYVEYNFIPEDEELKDLYMEYYELTSGSYLETHSNYLGEEWNYINTPIGMHVGHYAESIVYDESTGIIYYASDNEYYPVKNVQIDFYYQGEPTRFIYDYQFDMEKYILSAMEYQPVGEDGYIYSVDLSGANSTEIIGMILACEAEGGIGSAFDFTMLEEYDLSIFDLGEMVLDDVRPIKAWKLIPVNLDEEEYAIIHDEDNYYLNENYTLMVRSGGRLTSYWVISRIPESFDIDPDNNDYAKVNQKFQVAYEWRYIVFVIMGISFVAAILAFVFLMKAAGHKRKEEEVVLRFFDRIPFEIYTAAIACVELLGVGLISVLPYGGGDTLVAWVAMAVVIIIIMEILALCFLLSVAVRVKTKTLWKNTITYRICHVIAQAWRYFIRNVGFVWKAVVGFVVVDGLLMLFVFMLADSSYSPEIFFICLLIDIAIAVVYFVAIVQMNTLQEASKKLAQGNLAYEIDTKKMFWEFKKHAENMNQIGNGISLAVEERMKSEHFKTELITNVSHDIKTPLTSIINYVDLLAKEDLQNENAEEYIEVLQRQSSKLKKLIEDLVEASKASTGNLAVNMETLEAGVFLTQTVGEFEEKFAANGLELIINKPEEPVYICADGRHLWRVVDNLMNNILKYAQPLTRVYIHLEESGNQVTLTFRNMSKDPLNLTGEELKERFIRGDKSRNSEGHGLGLAIAQSLMDLMKAELTIHVDGDLFKVILAFAKKES